MWCRGRSDRKGLGKPERREIGQTVHAETHARNHVSSWLNQDLFARVLVGTGKAGVGAVAEINLHLPHCTLMLLMMGRRLIAEMQARVTLAYPQPRQMSHSVRGKLLTSCQTTS